MTNAQIILTESVKLMEAGILKGTGEIMTIELDDGTRKQLEIPEPIHTYAAWKSLGYQVIKGQKAIASFTIWKHVGARTKTDKKTGEETEQKAKMFLKKASFFQG